MADYLYVFRPCGRSKYYSNLYGHSQKAEDKYIVKYGGSLLRASRVKILSSGCFNSLDAHTRHTLKLARTLYSISGETTLHEI